jgi:hypothetical protein
MQDQERIRRRAHEIWEREGRPEGRHEEHWTQARQEIEAEGGGSPSPGPGASDDSPTLTAPGGDGVTPGEAAAAAQAVNAPRKAEVDPSGQEAGAAGSGGGQRT